MSPTDEIGAALGELAVQGIHDPATMPFGFPWTDAPADEPPRNCMVQYWAYRIEGLEPCLSLLVGTDSSPVAGPEPPMANPGS